MAQCGDASLDPGEECDDGDTDSYDDCTTSCTINHHDIGDPCQCTGSGCSDLDPTAGTIVGCDNVEVPTDGSGELACGRSINNTTYDIQVYAAEGSCELLAMHCEGFLCGFIDIEHGDIDTFSCPAPFVQSTDVRTTSGVTVTTMLCAEPCDGQNDCRWNAVEAASSPWAGECGQWQCAPDDDGVNVCLDPRI